ncbi:putative purine nucleoside protein [Naviculisporaceae sp. PSN 640]
MFSLEANAWYKDFSASGLGNLFSTNITTPGLSLEDPYVHCTSNNSVCQVTTSMAEINSAATMMALLLSPKFDFRSTYWLLAGIAGVNPKFGTLGSVALSQYAVHVALQYEFDPREAPTNFTSGYFGFGTTGPGQYPTQLYGTEVMELNKDLRDAVAQFATNATLNDSPQALSYRNRYDRIDDYTAALKPPSVIACDTATSDVYYSGNRLSEGFEQYVTLITNGTGNYCMTAQEDNAILEVLLRMDIAQRADFSRVILMRTGADFDRPPPNVSLLQHVTQDAQNGLMISLDNIYNAGIEIVKGIVKNWDCTFKKGIAPSNYIGDIWGSLGGTPDFGPGRRALPPAEVEGSGARKRARRGDKHKLPRAINLESAEDAC